MSENVVADTNAQLEALVHSWCDRRALPPLRALLSSYPMVSGLTDEWGELAQSLRAIRVHHAAYLTAAELDEVVRLNQVAERLVRR